MLIENDVEKVEKEGAWKKKSYRLCLTAWTVAWDRCAASWSSVVVSSSLDCLVRRYSLAADMLQQMSYVDSRRHLANVLEVCGFCGVCWRHV